MGYRIICPYFLQLSRESWWHNSQGRREFQIFSLMLAARFGYKHDQWQNTNPLFWRAFLIRINKHQRTQTTKPQALTTHNITLKLPYFKLPDITVPKKQIAKIVESHLRVCDPLWSFIIEFKSLLIRSYWCPILVFLSFDRKESLFHFTCHTWGVASSNKAYGETLCSKPCPILWRKASLFLRTGVKITYLHFKGQVV